MKGDGLKKYEEQKEELTAFKEMLKEARESGHENQLQSFRVTKKRKSKCLIVCDSR